MPFSLIQKIIFFVIIILVLLFVGKNIFKSKTTSSNTSPLSLLTDENNLNDDQTGQIDAREDELSIEALRKGSYPGSNITIEETLSPGVNYGRYLVSYKSEGYKIYSLLTVPQGEKPKNGWPVVIFNHGYIPPDQYVTTERYIAYTDAFSRNGYILLRPDYRGHGNSEGQPEGAYGSNAYTIDVLNAVSSIKKYKDADPDRVGMWGHSMGGFITLRTMVTTKDIKAGVIWAGVVASYPDLINNWRRRPSVTISPYPGSRGWRQRLIEKYGEPEKNKEVWAPLSANTYLKDISGPLQLHHGTADYSVPVIFSQKLAEQMKDAGKVVEIYTYEGDDHNIANNINNAIERSVEFFDKYLK